jgi:hypothetical protein
MIIIGVFLMLIAFLGGMYIFKFYSFVHFPLAESDDKCECTLHFIHGSVARPDCSDQRIRPGGLWGGHVEIEVDEVFYSFNRISKERKIHIFNKKNVVDYNAIFVGLEKNDWLIKTENDKITSIVIPISKQQKSQIQAIYKGFLEKTPYDYALFGMRCTASAHFILSEIGLFRPVSKWRTIVFSFYPKLLRRKVLKFAIRNNLKINLKEGIECRNWE